MIIGTPEYARLSMAQKQIILRAMGNISMKRIWISTLVALFVFPFSAILIEAYLWNFFIWGYPYEDQYMMDFSKLTSMNYIQLFAGYIIGYIVGMWIASMLGNSKWFNNLK